jgi:hypothetical protein
MVKLVKLVHPENASAPTCVVVLGIVKLVKLVHPSKAE